MAWVERKWLFWLSCSALACLFFIFPPGFEAGGYCFLGIVHNCLVHFKMVDDNAAFLVESIFCAL